MYTAFMDKSQPRNPAPDGCFSIQQASERTCLSAYTLRYYEQEGLLDPIRRDAGGRRRYTTEDVARVALLILMRDMGLTLTQIRAFAALTREGASAAPERRALIEAHQKQVQAQVDALCENLKMIEHKLDMMRRIESDPNEQAGWQERCLELLQKRNANRAQSAAPLSEVSAKTRSKTLKRRQPNRDHP